MESFKFNVLDVADWMVQKGRQDEEAGDLMTHLKLQKLLYYAQAWAMVFTGKSLFEEDFEAWTHGPVSRTLWNSLSGRGKSPIEEIPGGSSLTLNDAEVAAVLDDVWLVYGSKSAKYLEKLSHQEKPWVEARGGVPFEAACQTTLSKETMRSFYQQLNESV